MKDKYVIGVMSGSSLDGLDLAYCKFFKAEILWKYEFIYGKTVAFPDSLKYSLEKIRDLSGLQLTELDTTLGTWIGQEIRQWIKKENLTPDLISSHGHTVFHNPGSSYTLQIGSGAHIASITQVKVINNFRIIDIAKGGQGAPLVPIGELMLFSEYDTFINLGGIANISILQNNSIKAWDLGPFNQVLNNIASRAGMLYDENGIMASAGKCIQTWEKELIQWKYFKQSPPKSLGNEQVQREIILKIPEAKPADLSFTFCEVLSKIIAKEITTHHCKNVLITGGGAYHNFFLSLLKAQIPQPIKVTVPKKSILEFKEAIIFAFLGLLRENNEINILASVTGATSDSCAGTIYLP